MKERLYDIVKWLVIIVVFTVAVHSIVHRFNEGRPHYTLSTMSVQDGAVIVQSNNKTGHTQWTWIDHGTYVAKWHYVVDPF